MKILIDCDAMPRPLKNILCKIAEREKITTFFVATRIPHLPESEFIRNVGAGNAFNGADD